MSQDDQERKTCACTSRFLDLMRAPPPKREWFRKTTCPNCKKVYWTNRESDYCFDCESRASTKGSVT